MNNSSESRMDRIVFMLTEFSRGNFLVREEVTEEDDPMNTVVAGLNMLGEELDNYKNEIIRQRTFLQNILSSIDEVVYVRDINPHNLSESPYTFISDRAAEIIGISSEELAKEPDKWVKAIHPEDKTKSIENLKKILSGKEIVLTYRTFHYLKQQYRWIEDRVTPKLDHEGRITQIYGSARDVTEREETAIVLNRTSELVTRVITSSDQVFYIILLDQENPFKNTFTYLSAQVEQVIGYTIEDVRNDSLMWINAIHPDDVDDMMQTTKEMFSSKKPVTRVYRMKHKRTEEYVWLEDYVVPILDNNGWIREFYASARDITARKNAEIEKEKLIMELRRRHDELMQFNNIVSHNLRSPVASILGLAQFLQGEMPQEELYETTSYILQAAHAMDNLLHDLNTILSARSTIKEKMETFLLTDLIAAVRISLKNEIEESGTVINLQIEAEANKILSIKSFIQSAIYNLISNAIKYRATDTTPIITISGCKNENGSVVISVKDNGIGIDLQAHRHRLFVLYSRLSNEHEGKGLGLYMTKTQIEALGGTLDVESQPGKGTVFTITI